jgi:phage tail sheath gpL-like
MPVTPVVSPSVLTPGLYLNVNLLAGTASPGTGVLRVLIMATKSSAGDLTDDTEVRTLTGTDSAVTAFGTGTLGHLASKIIYAKYAPAIVDAVSPAAGSGSATLALTATGAPSGTDSTFDISVCGRTGEVVWIVGETPTQFMLKIINWINERSDDLPVSAAAGGAGVGDITSTVAGNIGNDVIIRVKIRTQTGTEAVAGATTYTNMASGSSDPDFTNALAAAAGREYHFILGCLSNADAGNVASSSNADKIYGHINTYNTGKDAKLQQGVCGFTGALATAIAATPHANGFNNSEWMSMPYILNGLSMPAEVGARLLVERLAEISLDPAANIIGNTMDLVYGAGDKIADKPTASESEQALGAGVSLFSYNAQDAEVLVRSITAHSQTGAGAPDRRLLDTQNVDAAYIIARDLRDNLPVEFANAKLAEDNDAPTTPLPPGVVQPKDIKAYIVSRLRFWVGRGVADGDALDDSLENNELIVEINGSDPTQVDIVVPTEILQPLAKMGVQVDRQPS